jgi:hypothetical protein
MQTPRGTNPATLTLASSGPELSGTWAAQMGTQQFSGGAVDGSKVSWNVKMQGPMGEINLAFAGQVDENAIQGTVQLGNFGSGSFSGTRA